jgi:hypothetical protein
MPPRTPHAARRTPHAARRTPHAERFDSDNKGHPLSQQQCRSQRMIPCKYAPKKDAVFSPQFITVCSYCNYLSGRRGWWPWPSAILICRAHNLARLELVKRDLCLTFSLLIFFAQPRYPLTCFQALELIWISSRVGSAPDGKWGEGGDV